MSAFAKAPATGVGVAAAGGRCFSSQARTDTSKSADVKVLVFMLSAFLLPLPEVVGRDPSVAPPAGSDHGGGPFRVLARGRDAALKPQPGLRCVVGKSRELLPPPAARRRAPSKTL